MSINIGEKGCGVIWGLRHRAGKRSGGRQEPGNGARNRGRLDFYTMALLDRTGRDIEGEHQDPEREEVSMIGEGSKIKA